MIRNRDQLDNRIKTLIVSNPGVSFTQLREQVDINPSTLGYRLASLELAGEITCKKQRNQNQYFPNDTHENNDRKNRSCEEQFAAR